MVIALTVFFFLVAILLVVVIIIQPGGSGGLGFFGGGSGSAFGAKTGNVLTKFTAVLAALFLVVSFVLGYLNARQGRVNTEKLININKSVEQTTKEKGQEGSVQEGSSWEDIGVDVSDTGK